MYSARNTNENIRSNSTIQTTPISSRSKRKAVLKDKSIDMLSVTISTVMLLASRVKNIPDEYSVWTDKYLKCIKDPHGKHPPNVKRILRIIGKPMDESMRSEEDENTCKCPQMTPPFWRSPEN